MPPTPQPQHSHAVDHCGVGVGANTGVGVCLYPIFVFAGENAAREVFEVDLVNDAGSRRNNAEIIKGFLAPAQELVALSITLILSFHIALECHSVAKNIDLNRMVDHQFCGNLRVDELRVTPHRLISLTHHGKINDAGNTGEILEDYARGSELDFFHGLGLRIPVRENAHMVSGNIFAILVA